MPNVTELPLVDVARVVLTTKETTPITYTWETASKAESEVLTEEIKGEKLIIKGVLKAQKRDEEIITGINLKFQDNVFAPEVVQLLQGGTLTTDVDESFLKYEAPKVGEKPVLTPFDIDVYTTITAEDGEIQGYLKYTFPNGKGKPVKFEMEDNKFMAPSYEITTAPKKGESPYTIDKVSTLPVI